MKYYIDSDGDMFKHSDKETVWWSMWRTNPQWDRWDEPYTTFCQHIDAGRYCRVPDTLRLLRGIDP